MNEQLLVIGGELKIPRCANIYGTSPCTAEIGVTGDYKCFNSPATCQVPVDYVEGEEYHILRFVDSTATYVQDEYILIPSIEKNGVRVSPMKIKPSEDIGERETVTINFSNHMDNDFILDPYVSDRDYHPWDEGDFFSRFDERYPNIQGYEFAVVRGHAGQSWDEMTRSHYIVDKGILSGDMSSYSITVRDVFTLLSNNKSQMPRPCDGFLSANIDDSLTPFTLEPSGIGSLTFPDGKRMYPDSGYAFIGEEVFSYTISGDIVTPTARGLFDSVIKEHADGSSMQVIVAFESMTSAEILNEILSYSEIDSSWSDLALWESEADTYDQKLYTGYISEPTQVDKIISDLMKDVCVTIYPDVTLRKIVFEYMRQRPSAYEFTDGNMMEISRSKNYDRRISAAYIKFGRFNPVKKMDENTNYLGRLYRLSEDQNQVLQKNTNVVFSHNSRFIPINLRNAADENAQIRLSRYSRPPRVLRFAVGKEVNPKLGKICDIESRFLRDARGFYEGVKIPFQITSVMEDVGKFVINAEEYTFSNAIPLPDPTLHIINIIVDQFNINLKTLHDSIYDSVEDGDTVRFILDPGIKFGARLGTTSAAVRTGTWPSGVTLELHFLSLECGIHGRGGLPGVGAPGGVPKRGGDAGDALRATYPITIYGDGRIWGGGGGGAGAIYPSGIGSPQSGGPGAGYERGSGASLTHGQQGMPWGCHGGNAGMPGGGNGLSPGGDAGYAIFGLSNVTIVDTVDIRGPTV